MPDKTAYEIIDMVKKAGNRYSHPDNIFGYGIPDFYHILEYQRSTIPTPRQ